MNLLAIDTSTDRATVAIAVNGDIYSEEQQGLRQHAQLLLPMIDRLLAMSQLSCSQLDAIVFGCGPGSFTGLRIACSVAKGLAYAHDLPVYPVSSLAAIGFDVYQTEKSLASHTNVLTLIDARMQQVYWSFYTGPEFNTKEHVTAAADIVVPVSDSIILAGAGFESYTSHLPQVLQRAIIKQCPIFPNARAMIGLVKSGKISAVTAEEALPVYVRNQVAQVSSKGELHG